MSEPVKSPSPEIMARLAQMTTVAQKLSDERFQSLSASGAFENIDVYPEDGIELSIPEWAILPGWKVRACLANWQDTKKVVVEFKHDRQQFLHVMTNISEENNEPQEFLNVLLRHGRRHCEELNSSAGFI